LFFIFLTACHKPEMKLPINDNPGLTGINDISQIYIFFKIQNGDTLADLHDGQTITTTHWVTHIDRRLPMKTLITPLQYLYKKRHKKSIHSKPGTKLYLSHVDTLNKQLVVTDFTRMQIHSPFYTSYDFVQKYPARYRNRKVLHVDIKPDSIYLDTMAFVFPQGKAEMITYLHHLAQENTPRELMINADYRIDYGRFNDAYSFLALADSSLFRIQSSLFLYNPQELKP